MAEIKIDKKLNINNFLTVLDSNFLEAILTLALNRTITTVRNRSDGYKEPQNEDESVCSPPLQRRALLLFLPHHLWTSEHVRMVEAYSRLNTSS